MKGKFFNLANIASLSRVLLAIVFVILVIYSKTRTALIIFIIAALTDVIDGHIARSTKQDKSIGIILDPICDKILIISAVIALVIKLNLPLWKLIIFAKDLLIMIGAIIVLSVKTDKKFKFKVNKIGKITTFLQLLTIVSIISFPRYENLFILLVIICSVLTVFNYSKSFVKHLHKI